MADRRVMLMVTRWGHAKDYVEDAFKEMLDRCVVGTPGVDVVWAGDRPGDDIRVEAKSGWVEDICTPARLASFLVAEQEGYDAVMWQGLDSLYRDRADFERLMLWRLPMVSALIPARTVTDFACARRWHLDESGYPLRQQYDVPAGVLMDGMRSRSLVKAGWPSADNLVFDSDLYDIGIDALRAHIPWYSQGAPYFVEGERSRDENAAGGVLDCSESVCLAAARCGYQAWIDCGVRVWHVHESGAPDGGPLARLWPNVETPLEELTWST